MLAKGRTPSTKADIVLPEGHHVAQASCTYEVRSDPRMGIGDWQGRLSGVQPEEALEVGSEYRLRLPDGREGAIIIQRLRRSPRVPTTVAFVGKGPPPGAAGQS